MHKENMDKEIDVAVNNNWIEFSEMNVTTFTLLLTGFSLTTSLLTHPLNVITTRQQAGPFITGDHKLSLNSNKSIFKLFQSSLSSIGWKGLFRGYLPMSLAGIPSQIVYFNTTEASREYLQSKLPLYFPIYSPAAIDAIQSFFSSILANATSLILYVPGELVSSRLQVQPRQGIGMINMTKEIFKKDGLKGLYRGFNASLISGGLFSAVFWGCYSTCRREFSNIDYLLNNPIILDGASGAIAGIISTVSTHPLDTIKTRIMTSNCKDNRYMIATGLRIIKNEGKNILWNGLKTSTYQSALTSTGFAIIYEYIKRSSSIINELEGGNGYDSKNKMK